MREYISYKKWWLEHQAEYYIEHFGVDDAEIAFEQYVNELDLYHFMETLSGWNEE